MARPTKRNRQHIKKINYVKHPQGVFINQKGFGELLERKVNPNSYYGVKEFRYSGKIHNGAIEFVFGDDLKLHVPELADYDHGYTLEGIANKLFKSENALSVYNEAEKRTFVYVNHKTMRSFVGDPDKAYSIYLRIYDNANGKNDNRWVVIFAEEAK